MPIVATARRFDFQLKVKARAESSLEIDPIRA
jgi:hypothetical protein